MLEFKAPDKRRPVVVLSRQDVLPWLRTAIIAPVTSTIHGAPSEVLVGVPEGLKHPSAVNLDHLQSVDQGRLRKRLGQLGPAKLREVCRALALATGCAED